MYFLNSDFFIKDIALDQSKLITIVNQLFNNAKQEIQRLVQNTLNTIQINVTILEKSFLN